MPMRWYVGSKFFIHFVDKKVRVLKETIWNRIWKDKIDKATWNKKRLGRDKVMHSPIIAEQYHKDSLEVEKKERKARQIAIRVNLKKDTTPNE
jgi:hypothetical protein